jgi:Pyruvate/2-oxoacid:ferredoxin oxidoreductase gamma subunit
METIGRPIANTCCVGALVKVTSMVGLEQVEAQIRRMLETKIGTRATEANITALRKAHEEVRS